MKFIWEAKNISLTSWLIQFIATTCYCEDCLHKTHAFREFFLNREIREINVSQKFHVIR